MRDKDEKQFALQIISEHQKIFQDSRKQTKQFMKQLYIFNYFKYYAFFDIFYAINIRLTDLEILKLDNK